MGHAGTLARVEAEQRNAEPVVKKPKKTKKAYKKKAAEAVVIED